MRATEQRARAEFEASTLSAALKLSCELSLQVFDTGFDVTLTAFDLKLLEVSRLLQQRQTSYRLMTIERATGTDFGVLPYTLSGEEVHTINFVYRSIVDRVFIDGVQVVKAVIPATEEGLQRFQRWRESPSLEFPPEVVTKTLLGKSIFLGTQTVKITDPYIEDVDRVQEELASGDGHEVTIVIRSNSNRVSVLVTRGAPLAFECVGFANSVAYRLGARSRREACRAISLVSRRIVGWAYRRGKETSHHPTTTE